MLYAGLICLALGLVVAGISVNVVPALPMHIYWVLTISGMVLLLAHVVRWRPARPF